jgi:sugar/nucleoside kinase (ribokinase family)
VPSRNGPGPAAARVLVVGDVVTDIVVHPRTDLAPGSDTPAAILITGGGAAGNTAAWLASAGTPTTLVARIGDDAPGRERLAELVAAGVECAIAVDPAAPTGTIVVLVARDGDRTMLPDRGANASLSPADVEAGFAAALAAPPHLAHLHLSGYTLLDPGSRPAGLRALAAARAAGLTVSVDAASTAPLAERGAEAFLGWIGRVDLLLANADEAAVLTGGADAEAAAEQLLAAAAVVVVKLGSRGALWRARDRRLTAPAEAVEAVDSTGAGDAFAAGLLGAWLRGAEPVMALRAGSALGARAVRTIGARPVATTP